MDLPSFQSEVLQVAGRKYNEKYRAVKIRRIVEEFPDDKQGAVLDAILALDEERFIRVLDPDHSDRLIRRYVELTSKGSPLIIQEKSE